MKRILVALDGSLESEQILGDVSRIGSRRTAVDLIRVLPVVPAGAALEDAETSLRRAAGRIRERTVRTFLWRGEPVEEIPHAAEVLQADLIAMTIRSRRGSVARGIVRRSPLPILMTRPGLQSPNRPLSRILVPFDGTEQSRTVCSTVRHLAEESDAEVVFLQVVVPVLVVDPVTGFAPLGIPEPLPDPAALLEDLAHEFRREGLLARTLVAHGTAAEQILRQARKIDADLIAMSTSARRGLSRLVLGSVAGDVVRRMACPVLLHRAEVPTPAQEVHAHGAE